MNFSAKFKSLNEKINVPDYRKKFFFLQNSAYQLCTVSMKNQWKTRKAGLKNIFHHCLFRFIQFSFLKKILQLSHNFQANQSWYEPVLGNKPNKFYSKLFFFISSFFSQHMKIALSLALIHFKKEITGLFNFLRENFFL